MMSGVSFISSMRLSTHHQQVKSDSNRTLYPPLNLEQLRQGIRLNTSPITTTEIITTTRQL